MDNIKKEFEGLDGIEPSYCLNVCYGGEKLMI